MAGNDGMYEILKSQWEAVYKNFRKEFPVAVLHHGPLVNNELTWGKL